MPENGQLSMKQDIRFTAFITLIAVGIGFVVVFFQQIFQPDGKIFFALFWSLACLIAGGGIGFLFGIPRFLQTDIPTDTISNASSANTDLREAAADVAASRKFQASPPRSIAAYRPNTNLDRISDWLTTIIVGLGLVELRKIIWGFNQATIFIASGLGGGEQKPTAGAIIIYFSIVGFLGIYLVTRLYLAQIFKGVDDQMAIDPSLRHKVLDYDLSNPMKFNLRVDSQSGEKQILDIPLNSLSDSADITVWSKVQLKAQNYGNSIAGYRKVIQMAPKNIQLKLEYANALYFAAESLNDGDEKNSLFADYESQLLDAYKLIDEMVSPETVMKVYRAITYHHLFKNPPDGFEATIKYGTEYLSRSGKKIPSGGILVNLAAAYGQKCRWLKDNGGSYDINVFCASRDNAYQASVAALALDRHWAARLQTLLQKNIQKDCTDNDLEVFENDNKFRKLLGLSPVAEEQDTAQECPN